MTDPASKQPNRLQIAQEANDLRQRVEDQFRTLQILRGRFVELLKEQDLYLKPILINEHIPPLVKQRRTAEVEESGFKPAADLYDNSWWPTGEAEPEALIPQTGWGSYSMRLAQAKALGVSVCGMSSKKRQRIVGMIGSQQEANRDFRPVFLTDSLDFSVFIPLGFVAEYIPAKPKRANEIPEWTRHAAERRGFVIRKWGLQEIIQFGSTPFGQ